MNNKVNLLNLDMHELESLVLSLKMKRFRAQQIWNWVYVQGKLNFNDMGNISPEEREVLSNASVFDLPVCIKKLVSSDATQKWLMQSEDGSLFESVFIPERTRGTLCISSQVGCFVGCKFCNTASQGFKRNLTSAEIVAQLMHAKNILSDWPTTPHNRKITNLVFMGMGEPLFNYDNLTKALKIITDKNGLAFSSRNITVSTSGITNKILPLGVDTGVNLAVSLHSANPETRSSIMPINKKYPLLELLKVCKDYPKISKTERVTFEYIMLKDINDSMPDAKLLAQQLQGIKAKINLIPFNPWQGCDFQPSQSTRVIEFSDFLRKKGYICTIRKSRGQDIMAACGQLKAKEELIIG